MDIDTLHKEISDLHSEIAALLPVGNETSERARHLLDKAYSILQSDPSRSAEVEYYMQQVRSIVLRLHQARQWSDLYRQRLHVYLLGWLGLSAMVLFARFLFQIDLEDALTLLVLDEEVIADRHHPLNHSITLTRAASWHLGRLHHWCRLGVASSSSPEHPNRSFLMHGRPAL